MLRVLCRMIVSSHTFVFAGLVGKLMCDVSINCMVVD